MFTQARNASALLFLCVAACSAPKAPTPLVAPAHSPATAPAPASLDALAPATAVDGFVAEAVYVDDDGRARGARFVHERTRFVFDYLQIESAPQAFLYAMTYPDSDGGLPHTQEHLLLGKGNKGRVLGNTQHSDFAGTSAFTAQRRTAYDLFTSAGPETFWGLLRTTFDALLRPDYSDEEILREVRNFGVAKQPDGSLALDEKGTVYNEMVRTFESPGTLAWFTSGRLVYGDHPLSYESGGTPEGIRAITPADIRRFHASHYQLGNMGMVGAFPASMPLGAVLGRVGEVLEAFAPKGPAPAFVTEARLPPPHGAAPGAVRVVPYPYATSDHPSPAIVVWPATRKISVAERTILEQFVAAFAAGKGSTMYKALVDQTTRALDLGATDTWGWVRNDPGQPVYFGVESVAAAHADLASMRSLRDLVRARLDAIAALPDGSPELTAFNARVEARVVEIRRRNDKLLDTPPEFGLRATGDVWIETLDDLARTPGFHKSLTYHDALASALALAKSTKNEWRDRIRAWGLLEVPHVVVTRPDPDLRAKLDKEREARVAAELARLEASYGTSDAQEALKRRDAEIARATEEIAKAEASVPMAPLAPDPPMTNDDGLVWRAESRGGVPVVASTFETMKSARVGIDLRLASVPEGSLPWLSVLPSLMTDVGIVRDGKPIGYEEVQDRLRREVLAFDVYISADTWSGRTELAVEAAGNDVDETKRALGWARDALASPDWRVQNLPRIRDVVAERMTALHGVMSGPEEYWLEATEEAYRRRDSAVLAHASSFLTRAHDAFRVSWQLEGGPGAEALPRFFETLAGAGKKLDRASLTSLTEALASKDTKAKPAAKLAPWVLAARALPAPAQSRVQKAGRDLGQFLGDLPDGSLAGDWAALCGEMAVGVRRPPGEALDELKRVLESIRHVTGARAWVVGSTRSQEAVRGDLDRTLATLDRAPAPPADHPARSPILERARARGEAGVTPFVALLNPSTGNGALVHRAPGVTFDEADVAKLTDYLAVNVFGGEGTQSFYKRIWGQALAYSGYVYASPRERAVELYTDRCADLPQLLRFVDGEVRRAPADPRYVDYAVAPAFGSRLAESYETRASGIASDLADGNPPERVRGFRTRILELRKRAGLADAMHARLVPAMGGVIPSLAGASPLPEGAVYFMVGPETQVAAYEKEIRRTRGEGAKVLRLWPRDFWDVPDSIVRAR